MHSPQAPASPRSQVTPGAGHDAPIPVAECSENTDCVSGQVCRDGACEAAVSPPPESPAPPPTPSLPLTPALTPTAPLQVSLTGSELLHDHFGVAKIHYNVQGGGTLRAKYLIAPFNRRNETEDCEPTPDGRFLLVKPDGSELTRALPDFETAYDPYFHGVERCDPATDHCRGVTAAMVRSMTYCRIPLPHDSGDVYTRFYQPGKVLIAAQAADGTWQTADATMTPSEPGLSDLTVTVSMTQPVFLIGGRYRNTTSPPSFLGGCRLDLPSVPAADGSGVFQATCNIQNGGRYTILVNGSSGTNAVQEMNVTCDDPHVELRKGDLHLLGSETVSTCGVAGSWMDRCNDALDIDLIGEAWRICYVTRVGDAAPLASVRVPWMDSYRMDGDPSGWCYGEARNGDYIPVADLLTGGAGRGATEGRLTIDDGRGVRPKSVFILRKPRNHGCTDYRFSVKDEFAAAEFSTTVHYPFRPTFEVNVEPFGTFRSGDRGAAGYTYNFSYDSCERRDNSPRGDYRSDVDPPCCNPTTGDSCDRSTVYQCNGYWLFPKFRWSGQHIRRINSTNCRDDRDTDRRREYEAIQPSNAVYGPQASPTGQFWRYVYYRESWSDRAREPLVCHFTATTYDAREISLDVPVTRGPSWCD